ncbi:MAG: hypothetical protein ACK5KQ_03820 [Anaerorhabdus sp.]
MKSKVLSVKNIPINDTCIKMVDLKPRGQFIFVLFLAIFVSYIYPSLLMLCIVMFTMSLFCLLFFPNRKIISFYQDYIVLYNQKNRNFCSLVYWDEILYWSYKKNSEKDELIIELVNNQVEVVECYSRRSVVPWLAVYAAEKERKKQ